MRYIILTLVLIGCGSSDPVADTKWSRDLDASCVQWLMFGEGTFTASHVCQQDAAFNATVDTGTYVVRDGKITRTATSSSCPATAVSGSDQFSISGDAMTLGADSFSRLPADFKAPFVPVLGCFDASGTFTEHSVAPL